MNKGSVKKRCKKERKLGDVTLKVLHQILRRVAYFFWRRLVGASQTVQQYKFASRYMRKE